MTITINYVRVLNGGNWTYNCPKNTLQLKDEVLVLALQTMSAYESCKLREMSLLLQNYAAQFRLSHHSVEMRRHESVE